MTELNDACTSCSVERAIGMVGGKWKLYVIRVLLVSGPRRFNGLLAAVDGISPKVLTENLRALEHAGVIGRTEDGGIRMYAMTPSGKELEPVLHAMGEWADNHEATGPQTNGQA